MKKALAVLTTAILLFGIIFPVATALPQKWLSTGRTIIDTNGQDGYTGDYVVIYNPSTYGSAQTGSLSGKIETSVDTGVIPTNAVYQKATEAEESKPEIISYHPDEESDIDYDIRSTKATFEPKVYSVGSTEVFLIHIYSGGSANVQFECLAVGEHCYIWTPTTSDTSWHPLDNIDSTYADIVCEQFDMHFDTMIDSFGDFYDPQGDGRINLMFYNIDDGWTPGSGYVAGFYTDSDYYYNSCAMINIDTYPQIEWRTTDGEYKKNITECYNVMMHEFQHLINANVSDGATTWMNEMKSAAAEEIVYPGSSISSRIRSWHGEQYMVLHDDDGNESGLYTKKEYPARSTLHTGATLYQWDSSNATVYYTYAQFSLLAQYLYSIAGTNTIFKRMSQAINTGVGSADSISIAMSGTPMQGKTTAEIIKNFRVALVANDAESYGGIYGFKLQDGYNPGEYYCMDNFYDTLSPVVFTNDSANIGGGGAIVVKPINNNFTPPQGADSSLVYIGITTESLYGYNSIAERSGKDVPEFEYVVDDYIIPNEKYVIVASDKYAMTNTYNASELGSVQITTADGFATGAITANELWVFEEHEGSDGYSLKMDAGGNQYVGVSPSGYPTLSTSAPESYYYKYDSDMHKLGVFGTPPSSVWTHLHGDINGFEFFSQSSASEITLYRQVKVDPDVVSGVTITPSSIPQLMQETSCQLTATIRPSTALNQSIAWSSENDSVATVDQNGLVYGVSAGATNICVTTEDGNYTAKCRVSVVAPLEGAAKSIEIATETDRLSEMESIPMSAVITPSDYIPENVESVTWQLVSGKAVVVQSHTNRLQATLTGYVAGEVVVSVRAENIDGTYCEATKVFTVTGGEPQTPDDEHCYKRVNSYESGKEYTIVAEMNGEYYALTNLMDKTAPFSLQIKKVTLCEIEGTTYISESMTSFSSIEWQVLESENSGCYTIQWKTGDSKLSATTTGTLALCDPYMDCMWQFENFGEGLFRIRQKKFTVWSNLVFDSELYAKPADLNDPTMSNDCASTFMLFEKLNEPMPREYIEGDANGDGIVNTADAVLCLRCCVGLETVESVVFGATDMNKNGSIDTGDALCILKLCVSEEYPS